MKCGPCQGYAPIYIILFYIVYDIMLSFSAHEQKGHIAGRVMLRVNELIMLQLFSFSMTDLQERSVWNNIICSALRVLTQSLLPVGDMQALHAQ